MSRLPSPLRDIVVFLVLQLITLPFVILVFRFIEPRIVAAIVAGSWFCISSSFMVYRSSKWLKFWKSPVFVMSLIFCLGISFPMLLIRALHWTQPFDELFIWGIPGPVFHRISNSVYLVLVGVTIWEFFKNRKSLYLKS